MRIGGFAHPGPAIKQGAPCPNAGSYGSDRWSSGYRSPGRVPAVSKPRLVRPQPGLPYGFAQVEWRWNRPEGRSDPRRTSATRRLDLTCKWHRANKAGIWWEPFPYFRYPTTGLER